MRINEDYLDNIETVDVEDKVAPIEDESKFDFGVFVTTANDNAGSWTKTTGSCQRIYNYLQLCPYITRNSTVGVDHEDRYIFSMSHSFKNPSQIMRFVSGLFKAAGKGDYNSIRIWNLKGEDNPKKKHYREDVNDETNIYCSFLKNDIDRRVWLRAAQICDRFVPDNSFTPEQILNAIPGVDEEKFYENFIVEYKTKQFKELENINLEDKNGWFINPDALAEMVAHRNTNGINYTQLLTLNLAEGNIRVYTENIDIEKYILNKVAKNPVRFCKNARLLKENIDVVSDFLFAYLGTFYYDNGTNCQEPYIAGLCIKYDSNETSVDEIINRISA